MHVRSVLAALVSSGLESTPSSLPLLHCGATGFGPESRATPLATYLPQVP